MSKPMTRRRKAIIRRRIFLSVCCLVLAGTIALGIFIINAISGDDATTSKRQAQEGSSSQSEIESKENSKTDKKKPKPKETFATVLSTGDIMVHSTQVDGARQSDGSYDFSCYFKECAKYFGEVDLSVANLEITFGGKESGAFSGYPAFNTPDSLADAIKASGLNFLITSNNHSYDTGLFGLKRTVQILKQKGIEFIGTREDESTPLYTVKEVNGIKIGIADYTYETSGQQAGRKYLNGNIIAQEANNLIATFDYNDIDKFYTEAEATIKAMKQNGAEFIVFYMHWGNEYQLQPNTWQKTIAQKLSNLGVDIIIGSHPHVIQPVELIHSEDGQNTTVCLYSTGNAISNQRQELMDSCPSGHTEDGLFFTYTLRKYGDEVTLEKVNIIPTWVNKYKENGKGYYYTIYPLPSADAGNQYGFSGSTLTKSRKSYERTKKLVAEGLTKIQREIGCEITFK